MIPMSFRYVFTIIVATLLSFRSPQKKAEDGEKKNDTLFFLAALIVILFIGLRTKYNDTGTYIGFWNYDVVSFPDFWNSLKNGEYTIGNNPGFHFICSVLKLFNLNANWYLLVMSVFTTGTYFWFINKYSGKSRPLAVYLFMVCGASYLMAALKQVTATAIALIALDRFFNGKKWRSLILLLFAITVHPYVFLYFAVPFLYKKKPWTGITYIMLVVFLLLGTLTSGTLGLMEDITGALGDTGYTVEYIMTGSGVNALRFLVYLSPVVLGFVYQKELFQDSDDVMDLFAQLQILSMSFMFLSLFIAAILVGRLPGYFSVPSAIALAWMLQKLYDKGHKLYLPIAVVLYFAFFAYEEFINKDFNMRYGMITLYQLITGGV